MRLRAPGGSEPLFGMIRERLRVRRDSVGWRGTVFAHNAGLTAFSLWVACGCWPLLLKRLSSPGRFNSPLQALTCEPRFFYDERDGSGFAGWALVFYVSKFYEFADTWILVLKNSDGKYRPSFLQKFHHVGVVLFAWLGMATQSNPGIWSVCMNSTVHTLMYAYYAMATVGLRAPTWVAKVLTTIQMGQFVVAGGLSCSFLLYSYSECPASSPAMNALFVGAMAYILGLIYLFNDMRKKKYAARVAKQIDGTTVKQA